MRKSIFIFTLCLLFGATGFAQTLEELKATQAAKTAMQTAKEGELEALKAEIATLQTQINRLSGWRKGLTGILGFDLSSNDNWVGSPNPNASSSSLNVGITGFLNKETAKTFWNNALTIDKQWADIDLSDADTGVEDDGLFDNAVADLLNVSSLAGYKLTDKFALSAQGELNTSVENFLSPGTFDLGLGATWLPIENMTVVVHPFNYRYAWAADGTTAESTGSIGAKVRVDYFRTFDVAGKQIAWTTYLSGFAPYQENDPSLLEYTWNNKFAFNVWNGIGVGISYVFRNAEFESPDAQQQFGVGLTYNFIK